MQVTQKMIDAFRTKLSRFEDIELIRYAGRSAPSTVRHFACGETYDIMPRVLLTGHRCPFCFKASKVTDHDHLAKKVHILSGGRFSLMDDVRYVNNRIPVRFKHNECGHEFTSRSCSFFNKNFPCAKCSGKLKKTIEVFIAEVEEAVGDEYTVLSDSIVNIDTCISMRHNACGHVWDVRPHSFMSVKTRCPQCHRMGNTSKGEQAITAILAERGLEFIEQAKIVKNPTTGRWMPCDFYIPSINLVVEFYGKQHYEEKRFSHNNDRLRLVQLRDDLKKKLVMQSGISFAVMHFSCTLKGVMESMLAEVISRSSSSDTAISIEASKNTIRIVEERSTTIPQGSRA